MDLSELRHFNAGTANQLCSRFRARKYGFMPSSKVGAAVLPVLTCSQKLTSTRISATFTRYENVLSMQKMHVRSEEKTCSQRNTTFRYHQVAATSAFRATTCPPRPKRVRRNSNGETSRCTTLAAQSAAPSIPVPSRLSRYQGKKDLACEQG